MNKEIKPESYILSIEIELDTTNIIKWCFPELKINEDVEEFKETLYKDKGLNLNKKGGLCGRYPSYSYHIFYDVISGLNPVYRSKFGESKELVFFKNDEIEERESLFNMEQLFEESGKLTNKLQQKYPNNHIGYPLIIRPDGIGFCEPDNRIPILSSHYPALSKINWIGGRIPYDSLIKFYRKMEPLDSKWKHVWDSMKGKVLIRKFPKFFEDIFNENKVKYNPNESTLGERDSIKVLSYPFSHESNEKQDDGAEFNTIVDSWETEDQVFETPYYTLTLNLKFYTPPETYN